MGPNGLRQAMYLEKVPGFARIVLQQFKIHPGDSFLIFSSTGINGVVIEMALLVKPMGLPVVAVTSLQHTSATPSRHPSGRKLAEIADVTVDNCSPPGDAATEIEGIPYRVGPVSSIGAIAVVNALKTRTAELLVERGVVPTVLTSPHFVGDGVGEEQLERVYEEYFRRVKQAYDGEGAIPVPEASEVAGARADELTIRAPLLASADVVVVGSGSAGSCAAIAAARGGASVVLIEKQAFLGGTSTAVLDTFYGFYTPGSRALKVVGGIPDDVVAGLRALGPVSSGPTRTAPAPASPTTASTSSSSGSASRPRPACASSCTPSSRAPRCATAASPSVLVATKAGLVRIAGRVFIDASGDADLCHHAGFGYELAGEHDPAQTLTTTFRMVNVDIARRKQISTAEVHERMAEAVASGEYDLPRREGSDHITPVEGMIATIMTRLDSYRRDGDAIVNATDPVLLSEAEMAGRRQAFEYARFLRDRVPGYEEAELVWLSSQIGVRETRRVYGDERLTREDVLGARRFDDEIGPLRRAHRGPPRRCRHALAVPARRRGRGHPLSARSSSAIRPTRSSPGAASRPRTTPTPRCARWRRRWRWARPRAPPPRWRCRRAMSRGPCDRERPARIACGATAPCSSCTPQLARPDERLVAGLRHRRHAHQVRRRRCGRRGQPHGAAPRRTCSPSRRVWQTMLDYADAARAELGADGLRGVGIAAPGSWTQTSACATCPARCPASRTSRCASDWRRASACRSAASTTAPPPRSRSGASARRAATTTSSA